MADKVAVGESPWIDSWQILKQNTDSSLKAAPGAVEIVYVDAREGRDNYIRVAFDAAHAYQLALRYRISNEAAYADKAVEILNAWAARNTNWMGNSNVSLRKGLYGSQFACAAELLRDYEGWRREEFKAFQDYMREQFYGGNHYFLEHRHGTVDPHYWANWGLANVASMMAIGVLCDDRMIFDEALKYVREGAGSEAIANAVCHVHPNGLGQWQESGRDQAHTLMVPQLLGMICEIAWNQGVDLYSHLDNRFLAGVEYISKYNLGHDVPYVTFVYYHGHPGKEKQWIQTAIHGGGRGIERPGWDLIYNHYVNRRGMAAPYTRAYAERSRPEGGGFNYGRNSGGFDSLGFTTLTHNLDPIASGARPGAPRPVVRGTTITLSWTGSAHALSYEVKRATISGGPFTTIATVGPKCLSYLDSGRTPGETHHYIVSANTPSGGSLDSDEAAATADRQLYGDVIGTDGSYQGSGADKRHVFDGSLETFFDPPTSGAWAGIDLGPGRSAVVSEAKFAPCRNAAKRMIGGRFQGSNTHDFSRGVEDLFVIGAEPAEGVFTTGTVKPNGAFRYLRYIPTEGDRWCNVAEIQFYGERRGPKARAAAPVGLTTTADVGEVALAWNPRPAADSYNVKRAAKSGGPWVVVENTTEPRFRDTGLGGGVHYYVVSAITRDGESANSAQTAVLTLSHVGPVAVASASHENSSRYREVALKAFDGNPDNKWYTGLGHASAWLQADLGAGKAAIVMRYDITSADDVAGRDPKAWRLLGSNDGSNWTTLDTRQGETFFGRKETRQFKINNASFYRHYRLDIQSNQSGRASDGIQLAELSFLGRSR